MPEKIDPTILVIGQTFLDVDGALCVYLGYAMEAINDKAKDLMGQMAGHYVHKNSWCCNDWHLQNMVHGRVYGSIR